MADDFSAFESFVGEASKESPSKKITWQEMVDEVLDPSTDLARRQILLSELLSMSPEIQSTIKSALMERNVDKLMTPKGKRIRSGTRAVARQITNDILPYLLQNPSALVSSPPDVTKVGPRILSALTNQIQNNFQQLQGDLANPRQIPERITKQTSDLVKEASNVFAETPAGLQGPAYTVIASSDEYEIRDYAAYKVVSTNMSPAGEIFSFDNLQSSGAAFNTLASYLFGANQDNKSMAMTTPVSTTLSGEMRFYLADNDVPEPLSYDKSNSVYETGNILVQEIPAARLACRRFSGFCTNNEVNRQKEALLYALEFDGVELDVGHGEVVPHVVFQYNPPYTFPVLRRNEIAVPVWNGLKESKPSTGGTNLDESEDDAWQSAPSD